MFGTSYTGSVNTYRSASEINSAMARVYNYMMLAILNSAIVSYLVSSSPGLMALLFGTVLKWVILFSPLIAIFVISYFMDKVSKTGAQLMLHGFAALMGLSLSTIFVIYTSSSIFMAFVSSAILFGVMSVYGYFTKKDLSSVGQFMIVGLIAIIIASIVNIFVGSSVLTTVISALAIIIFLGLTAYDTQRIREMVSFNRDEDNAEVSGALSLYMNFINIFINLLQLFGDKKD
jgi:FtsH-binding integral membrane protein